MSVFHFLSEREFTTKKKKGQRPGRELFSNLYLKVIIRKYIYIYIYFYRVLTYSINSLSSTIVVLCIYMDTIKNNYNYTVQNILSFFKKMFKLYIVLAYTIFLNHTFIKYVIYII